MASDILRRLEDKMQASVKAFANDLATIRTGRASPALVEHIKADYAGVPTPLNQMASISAPEARLLVINPWDKAAVVPIEKALLKSELSLNPTHDGSVIRIVIPPLSQERRQELIKVIRRRTEERKVMLRTIRHDALDELKKAEKEKTISQDDLKRALDALQKLTDRFIARADEIARGKETEILEV
ncbi:MAG: ribosome recycling factor [Chloroflexi bacterium]|nr:ribosome recycling factor [Chloroflexota bacterium]